MSVAVTEEEEEEKSLDEIINEYSDEGQSLER
jgi:hypothetical protein